MVKIDIIRQFSLVNDYTRNLANANIVEVMSMWLKLLDSIEQFCPSKISYFDIVEIRKICSAVKKNPNSLNKQIGQFQQYIKKIKIIITKLFDLSELDEAPPINDLPRQYNGKQISKIAQALIKNGKFI